MILTLRALVTFLLLVLTGACASSGPAEDDSLYKALGERRGIAALVDATLDNIADDSRIVALFADTDIGRLEAKLEEQLCHISGGPCRYTGDSMARAHAGLDLGPAEFNAFVEDLRAAMAQLEVPRSARNRLLARLAPMRGPVLEGESAQNPEADANADP
jgi:hemoglobin